MKRTEFREQIAALDVWDTHTHLIAGELAAADFWDIGHYFWYLRELKAAGYPSNAGDLPEKQRAEAYAEAFAATRNTSMHWVVCEIFRNLYDLEITDAHSILQANEAVKASASDPDWPVQVLDRLGIRRIVVNIPEHAPFEAALGVSCVLPRIDGDVKSWIQALMEADDPAAAGEDIRHQALHHASNIAASRFTGLMTSFGGPCAPTAEIPDLTKPLSQAQACAFVLDAVCRAAESNGLFVQFFLGMERGFSSQITAHSRTDRIQCLHGLFERYDCEFDLVLASNLNNMDAVQAARMFTNVHVGGLWWFNFRESSYADIMQYRIEALPACKSSLVASDARCVEWCYGKICLVKRLLADFLYDRIERGLLDEDDALWVGRQWLYDAPKQLFEPQTGD